MECAEVSIVSAKVDLMELIVKTVHSVDVFHNIYIVVSPMTLGSVYGGYVESNSWNYYIVQAQSENSLAITLNELNNGDCDLYVKQGMQPTKFDYDFKNVGISSTVQLTIPEPTVGAWYIGVYGYSTCAYTISVNLVSTCPGTPQCSGNGICTQGICQCNEGFGGPTCSIGTHI